VGVDDSMLGTALVQVVDDSTIKFEVFPGKGEREVVGFSDGARIYKR